MASLQGSQAPSRIHASLENGQTYRLAGNTRPLIAVAQDQGEVSSSLALQRVTMHFSMSAAQQTDLQQLLAQQVNKKSSLYHQWLTPEQYGERFGLNTSDLQKVTAWLARQGFANVEVSRSRSFVTFSGTASQAQAAFQTTLHNYMLNGEMHYANSSDPLLPKALEGMVAGIRGLSDFHPKPHLRPASVQPHFTSSISGNHFLTPDDWATIYDVKALYGAGIDGTGQKIVVIGQSDINLVDIQNFRTAAGLSQNNPQVVLVGRDPGAQVSSGDQGESELDLEWAGGIAKNATIIFVNSADVFNTSLYYAIDNNLAPVISITYGDCEADEGSANVNTLNSLFQQAVAQGISLVAAAGDNAAADCDTGNSLTAVDGPAVDFPGSSPYVTAVGGTTFSEGSGSYWSSTNDSASGSALSYIPEVVWNDDSTSGLAATGGGASIFFTKPSWQTGTGVPNDGFRDVPDVAFAASPNHDGYLVCTGGGTTYCQSGGFRDSSSNLDVVGGTSAAAPSFAAVVALLNQKTASNQGLLNPTIYSVASISTDAFHDITSGNNIVACRAGSTGCPSSLQFGFSAAAGYDEASGWGSVDATNLLNEWLADFGIAINPTTLSLVRGTSGSATVTVSKSGNFSGTVKFTCAVSGLTNTTCSIPGTVTGSGTATLTITPGSTASAPPGWHLFRTYPDLPRPWLMVALAGLLVCGAALLLPWHRASFRPVLAYASAFCMLVVMVSCGSGGGSTTSTLSSTPATLSLAAAPSTLTLSPGGSGTSTATVTTGGSFTGTVALAVAGAPTGVTASLGSSSLSGSGTSTLTVAVSSSTAAGTYPLTITASGSGLTATSTVNLTVAAQTGTVTVTANSGSITTTTTLNVTLN